MRGLTLALCLAATSARDVARLHRNPLAPKLPHKGLEVRGGLMDVSPELAAKAGTTILSANAAMMSLSPSSASDVYGISFDPIHEWMAEGMGFVFLGTSIMAWLALNGASTNTVIGCGCIPQVVEMVKTLLNDTPGKLGLPNKGMIVNLVINVFAMHALLTGQEYADNVAKFMVGFFGLNAVAFILAPEAGAGAWGVKGDDKLTMMIRAFGWFIGCWSVLAGSLIQGVEATKAIGYAFIPALGNIIDSNFVSKTVEKYGMDTNPQVFWAVVQLAVIAFTCA